MDCVGSQAPSHKVEDKIKGVFYSPHRSNLSLLGVQKRASVWSILIFLKLSTHPSLYGFKHLSVSCKARAQLPQLAQERC